MVYYIIQIAETSRGALIEQKLDLREAGLQANYLAYLTNQNRIESIIRTAARLLAWNREADTPVLLAACDRLIADDRTEPAVGIWNQLAQLHKIPYSPLAPRSGRSLTDGGFTVSPTSQGFDWRLPDVGGVATLLDERPDGLRISFSGRQPESCDVVTQILPVMDGADYELRFLYLTTGIAPETGLGWRIMDLHGSKTLAQGESLASESEREGRLPFGTPAWQRPRAPDAQVSARSWNYPHRRLHRSARVAADAGSVSAAGRSPIPHRQMKQDLEGGQAASSVL
jgi:hypothetical protein